MGSIGLKLALRHRGLVTAALLVGLLVNLLVIGRMDPPADALAGDLPLAAQCQGGGPGCAEQPMIPPPSVGLPQAARPVSPAFGALVAIEPAPPAAIPDPPPDNIEHPPAAPAVA
jgi:hypothetical protein